MKLLLTGRHSYFRNGISRVFAFWGRSFSTTTSSPDPIESLQLRISRSGNPTSSMGTILDQWLEQGRHVKQSELQGFIKQLRKYRRFGQALQISEWMSEQRNHNLSNGDIAIRLDLISKVHGLEQAEKYFNSIPQDLRVSQLYGALLNCYAYNKSLEKAEEIMDKIRELGFAKTSLPYNVMLSLYAQLGKHEKLDIVMQEMEGKGVNFDKYTFNIRLNAYGATSDLEGMEKLLMKMEVAHDFKMNWNAYTVAANCRMRQFAYEVLITVYASTGNKHEVCRIWNLYKNIGKVYNSGYVCIISSLMKLEDIDGAEKILEEWESADTVFDVRVPNIVISGYCRKGLLGKAEAYVNRLIESGKVPESTLWDRLATGYHVHGQMAKSVETMKRAILVSQPGWKPNQFTLAACYEYSRQQGDMEAAEEFLKLLKKRSESVGHIHDKLVSTTNNESLGAQALVEMETEEQIVDGEAYEIIESKDE
ncbi:hypothetical protein Pint_02235 [Pistacia integerrima]|uniref:Uncharacterized protein n=1 Tax=Pistacia integerrima TaxID=434235 RepID=A0ACC0ZDV6_9ROSI|nr:hypothetical protein Pint_02235 [Pistacia integerrima]